MTWVPDWALKLKLVKVQIKGKIEIEYYSKDDLERILFELKK